jgi:hypothetical protein
MEKNAVERQDSTKKLLSMERTKDRSFNGKNKR